jgi:hypothetical protein
MKNWFILSLLVLFTYGILAAQAGSVDSTFGNNGVLFFERSFTYPPPYSFLTSTDLCQ